MKVASGIHTTGPGMKKVSRVSATGHDNPGLELGEALFSQVRLLSLLYLCATINLPINFKEISFLPGSVCYHWCFL